MPEAVNREELMTLAEQLRKEATIPGQRPELPFVAGQAIGMLFRLLEERDVLRGCTPRQDPVPVSVTKKEDDPAGVIRISAGGTPRIGYYCVIRGDLDPVVLCLEEVMGSLKSLQRVAKHPPNCPDCARIRGKEAGHD